MLGSQRSIHFSLMILMPIPFSLDSAGERKEQFGVMVCEHPKQYNSGLRMPMEFWPRWFGATAMFQNSLGGKSEELWTCYREVVCLSWLYPYLGVHNLGRHIPEF